MRSGEWALRWVGNLKGMRTQPEARGQTGGCGRRAQGLGWQPAASGRCPPFAGPSVVTVSQTQVRRRSSRSLLK